MTTLTTRRDIAVRNQAVLPRETMIFLQRYGITAALAMKIYKQYKESAIHVMQTNPYSLADHIQGVGFRKADQIAQQIGIPLESPHRIRGAL